MTRPGPQTGPQAAPPAAPPGAPQTARPPDGAPPSPAERALEAVLNDAFSASSIGSPHAEAIARACRGLVREEMARVFGETAMRVSRER